MSKDTKIVGGFVCAFLSLAVALTLGYCGGYDSGRNSMSEDLYDNIYEDAYEAAYDEAYATVRDEAYEEGFNNGFDAAYDEAENSYIEEIEKLTQQYEDLLTKNLTSNPEFYYAEAYIISQEDAEDETVCVTWEVGYSEVQAFVTYENGYLEEDVPYLLTMYSNGTDDILDDEIVIIWGVIH